MTTLKAYLFGKFRLEHNGNTWKGVEGCKTQELFCYLLTYRTVSHSRDSLATLLWGETSTAQSKKYLRQALWKLRVACDQLQSADKRQGILSAKGDMVYINPSIDVWVDAETLETLHTCLRSDVELNDELAEQLNNAVALYSASFLEGTYSDWCIYQRERLENIYLEILDRLSGYCETRARYRHGLEYCERILKLDRARETTHQQMMRMRYLEGDRTGAIHQFERCTRALKDELDVAPGRRTVALYEQICAEQVDVSRSPRLERDTSLPDVVAHLQQMQQTLYDVQRQLQQEIHLVERFLPR